MPFPREESVGFCKYQQHGSSIHSFHSFTPPIYSSRPSWYFLYYLLFLRGSFPTFIFFISPSRFLGALYEGRRSYFVWLMVHQLTLLQSVVILCGWQYPSTIKIHKWSNCSHVMGISTSLRCANIITPLLSTKPWRPASFCPTTLYPRLVAPVKLVSSVAWKKPVDCYPELQLHSTLCPTYCFLNSITI